MKTKGRYKVAAVMLTAYAISMYFSLRTKSPTRVTNERGYQSIKASFMVARKLCAEHTNHSDAKEVGDNSK